MKKALITTTVAVHSIDNPVEFADSATTRDGSITREQILHEKTVCGEAEGATFIIPYHAIIAATFTKDESDEITPPEDDFCKNEEGDDGE